MQRGIQIARNNRTRAGNCTIRRYSRHPRRAGAARSVCRPARCTHCRSDGRARCDGPAADAECTKGGGGEVAACDDASSDDGDAAYFRAGQRGV